MSNKARFVAARCFWWLSDLLAHAAYFAEGGVIKCFWADGRCEFYEVSAVRNQDEGLEHR